MNWQRFAVLFVVILAQIIAFAQAPAPTPPKQVSLAEIERMYLDGKITAREYQKLLHTHRIEATTASKGAVGTNDIHARALEVLHKAKPNMAANPQGPAIKEPLPEPARSDAAGATNETAKAAALQDVESKLDELIRLKQAREQTNSTTTSTNTPAPPKTQRERLDAALRLHIQGKLTDAEYKELRAKILAEPDKN